MASSPASSSSSPRVALAGFGLAAIIAFAAPVAAGTSGVLPVDPGSEPPSDSSDAASQPPVSGAGPLVIAPPAAQTNGQQASPSAMQAEPQSRTVGARPGENESGIQIDTLGGTDGSTVSAPGMSAMPAAPGTAPVISSPRLNSSFWGDTSRDTIAQNLPKLTVGSGSPELNELLRELLLTSASPLETANGAPSLLPLRLERLMATGRPEWVVKLASDQSAGNSPEIALWRAHAALAAGDDKTACSSLAQLPRDGNPATDANAAFAIKLTAYCQLVDGNSDAAIMTTELAHEQGLDDPLFYSLAAQASDGITLKADDPAKLDALYLALYRKAGRALPANAVDIAEPALLVSLSKDDKLPVDARIAAGERAAKLGALKGDELGSLYQSATFTQADFDGLKTATLPAQSGMRRALLYQAIKKETDPSARIYLFKLALATGETAGLSTPFAEALKPELERIALTPEYKPLAPAAIRTFLLLDDRIEAQSWYTLADSQNAMFGREARELSALMQINDKTHASWDQDKISSDIASDLSSGIVSSSDFARYQAVLLAAMGMQLEPAIVAAVPEANDIAQNITPLDSVLAQLHGAGQRRATGEVILLSLVALGDRGIAGASPRVVGEIVVALRAVGFEDDARRIATEALLAHSSAGRG